MTNKKLAYTIILCLPLIVLNSCQNNTVFNEAQSTKKQWQREDIKTFNYANKDTLGYYNLFINLRADNKYPYSNIFVIVKTSQPNGKAIVDTLQYEMADATGKMLGNGITDVKESILWFKSKHKFKYIGEYKFEIEHAVRKAESAQGDQALEGIYDVGLQIEKAQ